MHNEAQSNPALTFPLKLEPNAPYKIVTQSMAQPENYCSSHMGQLRTEYGLSSTKMLRRKFGLFLWM